MKPYRAIVIALLLQTVGVIASDMEFPKIGAKYRIAYSQTPQGYYWPNEVRILKRGSGLWCLVEYVRYDTPKRLEMWLNFSVVQAATEE